MEGLGNLAKLWHLYLYDTQIKKIENYENLKNLVELSINPEVKNAPINEERYDALREFCNRNETRRRKELFKIETTYYNPKWDYAEY